MNRSVFAAVLAVSLSASAADPKADTELRAVFSSLEQAWVKGDVPGILALHAEDAVVSNPTGQFVSGHAQMKEMLPKLTLGPGKVEITTTITSIRHVAPNVAVVDMDVLGKPVAGVALPDAGALPAAGRSSKRIAVVVKKGGKWLITDSRTFFPVAPLGAAPSPSDAGVPSAPPSKK